MVSLHLERLEREKSIQKGEMPLLSAVKDDRMGAELQFLIDLKGLVGKPEARENVIVDH